MTDFRPKEVAGVIEEAAAHTRNSAMEAAPPGQDHGSEKEKWMRQHK